MRSSGCRSHRGVGHHGRQWTMVGGTDDWMVMVQSPKSSPKVGGRRSAGGGGGRVDDGQTNSVLFHLSVWPLSVPFGASDGGRVDDGQTNSVLFD